MTETDLELHPWFPTFWDQFNPWKPWLWKRPMWIVMVLANLSTLFYVKIEPLIPIVSICGLIGEVAVAVLVRKGVLWFAREGSIRPDRVRIRDGEIEFLEEGALLISMKLETLETVEVAAGEISFLGRDEKGFPTNVTLAEGSYRPHSWVAIQRFATELKAHLAFP